MKEQLDLFRQGSMHKEEKPSVLASQPRRPKVAQPTADKPLIVSPSELSSFLRCRVQHHWGSQCKLEPVQYKDALGIGKLGHQILAEFYKLPLEKRSAVRMKKIAALMVRQTKITDMPLESKDLLIAMTTGYADWIKREDVDFSDKVIGLRDTEQERQFVLDLVPDGSIKMRGSMDILFPVRSLKHTIGFLESKFRGQIRRDEIETRIQLSTYLFAMRKLFPKMKRYIAYPQILRKQMPGPRVRADLYFREAIERTGDEIDQWALDTSRAALDMVDGAVYPNPMDSCSWACDFNIPCLLRGNSSDVKHVLKSQYRKRVYT